MSKRQLIDDIRAHNPSARIQFLAEFTESDLREYLARLNEVCDRRVVMPQRQQQVQPLAKAG